MGHHNSHHEWTYEGDCGPLKWANTWSNARGKHQSPINIETHKAIFDPDLIKSALEINYDSLSACRRIINTGHTFQVDSHSHNMTKIFGGPVKDSYKFLQFHMHWGDDLHKGSEHLIDNEPYAAEFHFVNWNYTRYKDPESAIRSNTNDGLLVLAVFVKIGKANSEFANLVELMHKIHLKDHHASVDHINMRYLLPDDISKYWTYPGSLTTPPCNECVQWIVFKNEIEISEEQLQKCHELYSVTKERLCNENTLIKYNDRPICLLNDRVVLKSFED